MVGFLVIFPDHFHPRLRVMRAAEIAALKFAMSLLEDVFVGATKTRAVQEGAPLVIR